ncbi:hypothetical protein EJ04DRAFT_437165 [Polyplosphaeria fusca]|uniref:Uncharacterized protein n=1 Tax=Polyplosphaeria fusca TaxID=682080 RepID=A0A9P4V3L6_9PLEO|nr:hypothetical protein EJ04DRAFT_437165 [Polyplosphaeria fusca]
MDQTQAPAAPFRFLDLPGEIRNRIYKITLCAFDPAPDASILEESIPNGIFKAEHSIETNILRSCKQVHREAYDVMVKTNNFVHVEARNILLSNTLVKSQLPVVTMDRAAASQFDGYVAKLFMHSIGEFIEDGSHFSFMILLRDWEKFCDAFGGPASRLKTWFANTAVTCLLDPFSTQSRSDWRDPISDYFSAKTQRAILEPLSCHFRGFGAIHVLGPVGEELKARVERDATSWRWTNCEHVLMYLQEHKQKGDRSFQQNNFLDAITHWRHAYGTIDSMRHQIYWTELKSSGGKSFSNAVAEVYYMTKRDCAKARLKRAHEVFNDQDRRIKRSEVALTDLRDCLRALGPTERRILGEDWRFSIPDMAELCYQSALW